MKTITRKHRNCPDGRLPKAKLKRDRPRNTIPITLPIHDLNDHTRYRSHRYTLDPDFFAVRTSVDINQHDLVKVDGEVLKVVSVSEIVPGAVEIRTVKFARYQA